MSRIDDILKFSPEQIKVLEMPETGAILVKGAAGSGKSTTAMYRAARYSNSGFLSEKIAVLTYNKALVKYLGDMLAAINRKKGACVTMEQVVINNIDAIAFYMAKKIVPSLRFDNKAEAAIIENIYAKIDFLDSLSSKSVSFFAEEFAWIKQMLLFEKKDYLEVKRSGRKDRLTKKDRERVWDLYEQYCTQMQQRGIYTINDYPIIILKYIEKLGDKFVPPYGKIIVDEAQDLSKAKLLLISKLVNPDTNSIMVLADAAQSIYQKGFSWGQVGLSVRGQKRSAELTTNYRNPEGVRLAANSLLEKDAEKLEYTLGQSKNPTNTSNVDTSNVDKPIVYAEHDYEGQNKRVFSLVEEIRKDPKHSCVILAPTNKQLEIFCQGLASRGISALVVSSNDSKELFDSNGIYLTTMHSVKGMEFDNVIITGLDDEHFPLLTNITDEEEQEEKLDKSRKLLYTCMTRARKNLYMVSPNLKYSRLIDEIDKGLIDIK